VQRFFFPGQDTTAYQDLGAFDGPMRITGLIVGDLYVTAARLLEAALRTPGPGTLVHPWYGDLRMVLTEPAELTFSQKELRLVRFTATFAPYAAPVASIGSSLDALLADILTAEGAVQAYIAQLLAPVGQALWLAGTVAAFAASVQSYWAWATGAVLGGVAGASGNPQLAAAATVSIAALGGVGDIAILTTAGYGAAVGALLAAVPSAIADASATLAAPAVGPGDAAITATPVDGRVSSAVLLAACTAAQAQVAAGGVTGGLALAQAAWCVLAAVQAGTTIAWTSNAEAQTWLAGALTALDATAAQAAAAAVPTVSTGPAAVAAGQMWTALQDARGTLVADMTATIGRLPQVLTVIAAAPLPGWLIANILAGDTPALIGAAYADLLTRNSVRNPALLPAGALETLAPASLPATLAATAA
jgi:prophage DNA circulation protein